MTDPPDRSLDRFPDDWTSSWKFPERALSGAALVPGEVLAQRYRIEALLARGGMGVVYRAIDLDLGIGLALKTIRPEIASDPASLRRFKQEVLLARSIAHPHVCRIYDLGRDSEREVSFLTMELLEGETLAERLRSSGTLSPEDALPIVRQVTDALDAAHRAGVVHRDLKTSNIMLVPTDAGARAVITDFGLAVAARPSATSIYPPRTDRARENSVHTQASEASSIVLAPLWSGTGESKATSAGTSSVVYGIIGTPEYMAPEQVLGAEVGPASDLYSLGVVLYEMTTGRLPFRGATRLETARIRLSEEPPRPTSVSVGLSPEWERAVLRLLSRKPQDRYRSGRDVVLELEGKFSDSGTAKYSLPAERDAFVGRHEELRFLYQTLAAGGDSRQVGHLVTVFGFGGTGKTRLVQRYAWENLSCWPGGIWFCDLSEAQTATGIAVAVASSLNVPLGKDDPVVQLGHAIAARGRSLIILDNFEQVAEYAEQTLGRWSSHCREASFLVTSRERLQLSGEVVLSLQALDCETHGVALFELRGRAHRPGFVVDAANRSIIEDAVAELDGIPLAIEMAASRLRTLSLIQLRDRLKDRFRVLGGGKRGRHATLEATLDWSWELLAPWEQSAIAQASVFEGGFTLEAAEAVIDIATREDLPVVLDVIQSLVDKSWLRPRVAFEAPRFEMYATVQDYVSRKLGRNGGALDVEARHGAFFSRMGSRAALENLDRHGGVEKRVALRVELDNLVAACRRAIHRGRAEVAEAAYLAADAVIGLKGPFALSAQLGNEVLSVTGDPPGRARVLGGLATAERQLGKMRESREHFEAALKLHRSLGDRLGEAVVLRELGALHSVQGRMDAARELFEAALTIHGDVDDRAGEGLVLGNLGRLHKDQGRTEAALTHYEAALEIHREVGNRDSEAVVLNNLGNLHRECGRLEKADEIYEAALAIDREMGNRMHEGVVLGNVGAGLMERGQLDACYEFSAKALAIHRDVGDRRSEGLVLANLGLVQMDRGRIEESRALHEEALAIYHELGDRPGAAFVLGNLGILEMEQGRFEEAAEFYDAALLAHREVHDRFEEGYVHINMGLLRIEQGQFGEARAHLEAALAIHREIDNPRAEGSALGALGTLHFREGRMDEARKLFAAAMAIHRKVGDREGEGSVWAGLGVLHAKENDTDEARRCFEKSIAYLRDLSPNELGKAISALGLLEVDVGNLRAARAALSEAEVIAQSLSTSENSELGRRIQQLKVALANDSDPETTVAPETPPHPDP